MKLYRWVGAFVLFSLLLAACAGGVPQASTPGPKGGTETSTSVPAPAAVQAAQLALAQQLGIDPGKVTVQGFEQAEWPNGCLGAGGMDEACTEAIVPGYGGILIANGAQWEFRTNDNGNVVRFIPGAALSARQVLAQQLHVDLRDIRIASFEKVEWPDTCLGIKVQGMDCAQVVTSGYKVVLHTNGGTYEFHTDENGGTAMLASAPQAEAGQAMLTWEGTGGVCQTAQIGADKVTFGTCGGTLVEGKFAYPWRPAELADFVNRYTPFEAETPAGKVTFQGLGATAPMPVEQRMLAEWAHLVFQEAAGGRGDASWSLAFTWHREGGIAGFCDDLAVYLPGGVTATTCGATLAEAVGPNRLSPAQLEQIYAWVDRFQPFIMDQKDAAVADAMSIRLVFSGVGQQEATEADKAAIQAFASELYTSLSQNSTPAGPQQ